MITVRWEESSYLRGLDEVVKRLLRVRLRRWADLAVLPQGRTPAGYRSEPVDQPMYVLVTPSRTSVE